MYEPGAILQILWSIGIEEQFYLVIAPLLSITPLKKFQPYLFLFTGVYFIAFHLGAFFYLKKYHQLYFFMSAGGALAILFKKGVSLHFKPFGLRVLVYTAFLCYFFTNWLHTDDDLLRHTIDIILFNVLILNLANEDMFEIRSKLLNHLGRISYGIYMYHMIVVNLALFIILEVQEIHDLNEGQTVLIINSLSVLLTVLISHLSLTYYESYFLGLKQKFRKEAPSIGV